MPPLNENENAVEVLHPTPPAQPAVPGETPEQTLRRFVASENARGREVFTGYKMPVNYPNEFLISFKLACRDMWETHNHENVVNLLVEYFNVPKPIVTVGAPGAVLEGPHYLPETNTIELDTLSVVSLLHEFRHHLQHCTNQPVDEVDARIFSVSLYARVFPVLYQKMSQSGRLIFS